MLIHKWIPRIASFMDKAGEAISTLSFALTYSVLLSTDVRRSLSLQRGKYVISFCFSLFKQSGINYPPTSSVPLSFKKGASFLMLSFNQLSHACPLQEENIPLHSCNLQGLHHIIVISSDDYTNISVAHQSRFPML